MHECLFKYKGKKKAYMQRSMHLIAHAHMIQTYLCINAYHIHDILFTFLCCAATKIGKRSKASPLQDWAEKANYVADKVEYVTEFIVNEDFGVPGAIFVLNEHPREFYLETIALEGLPSGRVYFPCYSWVHSKSDSPEKRVFFSNVAFLPQDTPEGIKDLCESDKASLRGTGRGVRKAHERIYDYDIYNDLGNPDKDASLTRPTLGNSEKFPYPRRCRTGRIPTKTGDNTT